MKPALFLLLAFLSPTLTAPAGNSPLVAVGPRPHVRAPVNSPQRLSCVYKGRDSVTVTWQFRRNAPGHVPDNIGTFARGNVTMQPNFGGLKITGDAEDSHLHLSPLGPVDSGIYICLFNTFGQGSQKGEITLTVTNHTDIEVSRGPFQGCHNLYPVLTTVSGVPPPRLRVFPSFVIDGEHVSTTVNGKGVSTVQRTVYVNLTIASDAHVHHLVGLADYTPSESQNVWISIKYASSCFRRVRRQLDDTIVRHNPTPTSPTTREEL